MKRLALATSALAVTALVYAAAAQAQQHPANPPAAQQGQDTRPTIAILDFDIGATFGQDPDDYQALRRGLAGMTIAELAVNPAVRVVERAQLQQIMQEQDLARSDRVDQSTALRLGQLLNARYMVTGTIYDVRGDFRIDARLFDVQTSQIIKTQRVAGRLDNIFDLVTRLAAQLMRDANLPPLERHADAAPPARPATGAPTQNAVMAYSRAVLYADRGDKDRAVEQYRRALAVFPGYTQARTDCNRLQAGACS
ncbi:MAG: CsgG/HfaB family protein [Gemmatimonadales bacterium]|jgi:TolB-like protein